MLIHDGSTFLFLETTAHALAATLGYLALDQNIQEDVYQHIISIIGHDRDPVQLRHLETSLQS